MSMPKQRSQKPFSRCCFREKTPRNTSPLRVNLTIFCSKLSIFRLARPGHAHWHRHELKNPWLSRLFIIKNKRRASRATETKERSMWNIVWSKRDVFWFGVYYFFKNIFKTFFETPSRMDSKNCHFRLRNPITVSFRRDPSFVPFLRF